jgi:glycosyltransferase involved in cell wall biosynthesis
MNMLCAELHGFRRDAQPCTECIPHGPFRALRYRCHKGSWAATFARALTMACHNRLGIYRRVDVLITPSAFMRGLLIEAGFPEDRVVHVPSFYEPGGVGDDPAPEADPPYILSFGRVSREKGLDVLVRAAKLLPGDIEIRVAGGDVDGELPRLQRLAADLGVTNLRFLGFQAKAELAELVRGALFTVVPSRWYDNCPMSVLESFAQGKPVIGADIGGIPEQITPECGMLFAPGDERELADKMTWLLQHGDERRRMGAAAIARLRTAFGARAHCETLLGIFRELTGVPGP